KIKRGELCPQFPHAALNHTLFILNFLNMDASEQSDTDRFWHEGTPANFAQVKWTDQWRGPDPVIIWSRGHACVSSKVENEACWLLEQLVRCMEQRGIGPESLGDHLNQLE
ncbi:hypothetical protein ACQP3F_27905, partial [Escherichia coli]